jgi:hypothetical protein
MRRWGMAKSALRLACERLIKFMPCERCAADCLMGHKGDEVCLAMLQAHYETGAKRRREEATGVMLVDSNVEQEWIDEQEAKADE